MGSKTPGLQSNEPPPKIRVKSCRVEKRNSKKRKFCIEIKKKFDL